MKRYITLILSIVLLTISGAYSCRTESQLATGIPSATEQPVTVLQTESTSQPQYASEPLFESGPSEGYNGMTAITLTIGSFVFSAKLYDNDTATAFLKLLPMTLDMSELNGNEKYNYLSDSLPTDSQRMGDVNAGDLMLYGSDCLVLFYESFSSSYNYTKLGYIEDASGLADALGHDSIQVAFAIEN